MLDLIVICGSYSEYRHWREDRFPHIPFTDDDGFHPVYDEPTLVKLQTRVTARNALWVRLKDARRQPTPLQKQIKHELTYVYKAVRVYFELDGK